MKKILTIGAGLTTLGLAILPISDVFAANSIVHTVTATVNDVISIASTTTVAIAAQDPGTTKSGTTTITINSNHNGGWNVTAVGSGTGSTVTDMVGSVSGTKIATGTTTSGTAGSWAMKLTNPASCITVNATSPNNFTAWHAVPSSATLVASNTGVCASAAVTANYQVYAGTAQVAGTYTGKVTYTIAAGTS